MNIGARLETVGSLVLPNSILADIGTDHAYLPVYLLQEGKIASAIAGDIAQGPCKAAENTIAMYNMRNKIQVRLGSGLSVLSPNEVNCISIAGMGGSTMVEILSADMEIAKSAERLILQPQTGAAGLRKWLLANGWEFIKEKLVWENKRLYEIIAAEKVQMPNREYSAAELEIGPRLLDSKHPLLKDQFAKQLDTYSKQLGFMKKSANAVHTDKYLQLKKMVEELEALAHECNLK